MSFETEHLLIREFELEDTWQFYENHMEENVRKWMPNESYRDIDEARQAIAYFINRAKHNNLPYVMAVLLKETGELIGDTGVNEVKGKENELEIGYNISDKYSGNGYATELLKYMTEFTFVFFNVAAVYGRVMHGNDASCRVLEKNGYLFQVEELDAEDDPYGRGMLVYKKLNENVYKDIRFETADLILKKAEYEDWKDLYYNIECREESAKYMLWEVNKNENEAKARMIRTLSFQKKEKYAFVVYLKESMEAIGWASMREVNPGIYEEMGIAVGPDFVRKGYGRQILGVLCEEAGRNGATEFWASYRIGNIACEKLLESSGFVFNFDSEERTDPRNGGIYTVRNMTRKLR